MPRDKPLVIQFTVKHEQNIDCGGGYVKLFDCKLNQADMHGDSPYNVMFGPDICGPGTKKVHVIFSHKGKNHLVKKVRSNISFTFLMCSVQSFGSAAFGGSVSQRKVGSGSRISNFVGSILVKFPIRFQSTDPT